METKEIMTDSVEKPDVPANPDKGNFVVAGVLAWLVPGAGHIYIGRKIRGVIIMVTIAVLFWMGMGMGGVTTVDRINERWWFLADLATGIHGLAGWGMHHRVYKRIENKIMSGPLQNSAAALNRQIQSLTEEGKSINAEIDQLNQRIRQTADPEYRASLQRDVRRLDQEFRQLRMDIMMRSQRLKQLKSEFIERQLVDEKIALVPPTATVARAYAGVAGLLNLMCIFDAVLLALIARSKKKEVS